MRNKPPFGGSWIRFHDSLLKEHPEFEKAKTVKFSHMIPSDGSEAVIKEFKISMGTLKRYCWEEFQYLRLTDEETFTTMHAIQVGYHKAFNLPMHEKLSVLLPVIAIKT